MWKGQANIQWGTHSITIIATILLEFLHFSIPVNFEQVYKC